ncbi:MAG: hypothetical protein AB2813_00270, partial [Candidatus Sedimenticola endophacoides]
MGHHQDRRQFWQAHYDHCHELGMTLKGYAEQEGLTLSHGKSTLRQNSHYVAWRYASFSKYRIPPGY